MIYFENLKKVNNKLNINYKYFFNNFSNKGNYILGKVLKKGIMLLLISHSF